MKQHFYLLFCTFLLLHTEGGIAQGFFEKKDIQPSSPDSLFFVETDSLEDAVIIPNKHRASPYTAAQQEYLSQPLESKSIDKNRWEQAKSGIDYSNDKVEKQKQTANTGFNPMWGVLIVFLKWF